MRFKPDMKLKYVYYYDTTANPMLDRRFPNATLREKMVEVCKIYGLDSNKFMAPEEIRKIIDLSGENNTFVRQIVRENGEKAWLRIYNDMQRFPSEKEISAAFKRMVMDLPKVGFVENVVILVVKTVIIVRLLMIRVSVTLWKIKGLMSQKLRWISKCLRILILS
mgnify:CR=1 FL=1